MSTATPGTRAESSVELAIEGMTCASCAARIEKRLNKLDGVTATVNYATEKAKVAHSGDVTTDDLVAAVEKAGYGARLPQPAAANPHESDARNGR
jgi:Cu+-exporting ATPase